MSIKLMSIVWDLDLAPGEKLVLLALADQANDGGWQCFPSVEAIAKRSGQGKRTVFRALDALQQKGHLTRHERRGSSTQYHVHPCQNDTPANLAPVPKTTETHANLADPHAILAPITITETSGTVKTQNTRELPDDWLPEPFAIGSTCRTIIDGWPPGEWDAQVEHFTAHHRAKGTRMKDWQSAWKTWVLNSRKFGNGSKPTRIGRPEPRRSVSELASELARNATSEDVPANGWAR